MEYAHHKLVHSVAYSWWRVIKVTSLGMEFEDVLQEAWIVCLSAQKRFDPSKGWAFSTYFYTAARNHFVAMIKTSSKLQTVSPELDDDFSLFDQLADESENPEQELCGAQQVRYRLDGANPLARMMVELIMTPPPCIQAQFDAVNSKRAKAKACGFDERHPAEINLVFISDLLAKLGATQTMLTQARSDIRALEGCDAA